MRLKSLLALVLVLQLAAAANFMINTTAGFDAGTHSSTATIIQNPGTAASNTLEIKNGEYPTDSQLRGLWHFDEGTGTNVHDYSVNNLSLTLTGATWVAGVYGNGTSYSGSSSSYASGSTSGTAYSFSGDFAIELWVSSTSSSSQIYVAKWNSGGNDVAWWTAYYNGGLSFGIYGPDNGNPSWFTLPSSTYNTLDGNWHHIVFQRSGSTSCYFYVDGAQRGSTYACRSGTVGNNAGVPLTVGVIGNPPTNSWPFNGNMDEIAVYNRALTPNEISAHYNSRLKYLTGGNWTSAIQTMPTDGRITSTTITYSGVNSNNYIDKIEWLKGGIVQATYDTNIVSGTSLTITSADLTSGSLENVNAAFQVKVYLVGNGSLSPVVTGVSGDITVNYNLKFTALSAPSQADRSDTFTLSADVSTLASGDQTNVQACVSLPSSFIVQSACLPLFNITENSSAPVSWDVKAGRAVDCGLSGDQQMTLSVTSDQQVSPITNSTNITVSPYVDADWKFDVCEKRRKVANTTETAGLQRAGEPVIMNITRSDANDGTCRDVRLTYADGIEITSQIVSNSTTLCQMMFESTNNASSTASFLVFFSNPYSQAPSYSGVAWNATTKTLDSGKLKLDWGINNNYLSSLFVNESGSYVNYGIMNLEYYIVTYGGGAPPQTCALAASPAVTGTFTMLSDGPVCKTLLQNKSSFDVITSCWMADMGAPTQPAPTYMSTYYTLCAGSDYVMVRGIIGNTVGRTYQGISMPYSLYGTGDVMGGGYNSDHRSAAENTSGSITAEAAYSLCDNCDPYLLTANKWFYINRAGNSRYWLRLWDMNNEITDSYQRIARGYWTGMGRIMGYFGLNIGAAVTIGGTDLAQTYVSKMDNDGMSTAKAHNFSVQLANPLSSSVGSSQGRIFFDLPVPFTVTLNGVTKTGDKPLFILPVGTDNLTGATLNMTPVSAADFPGSIMFTGAAFNPNSDINLQGNVTTGVNATALGILGFSALVNITITNVTYTNYQVLLSGVGSSDRIYKCVSDCDNSSSWTFLGTGPGPYTLNSSDPVLGGGSPIVTPGGGTSVIVTAPETALAALLAFSLAALALFLRRLA